MQKKILFVILPIFFIACNFLVQQNENPLPASTKPGSIQSKLSTPRGMTSSIEPFVIARIDKANGNLMKQLASEAQKADSLGLAPFLEFDASWCPPCVAIDKSIKAKDPRTMQAFKGVYLIRANVDKWGWGDGKNFNFTAIPIYYQLDKNGKPTGAVIDGGAWGEDIPENFSPVLDEFFHAK
jgi:thiol:disulfide interchange protein